MSRLAKIPEQVSFLEIFALYDNQLWLEDKCKKDQGFLTKFGSTLEVLAKLLKEARFDQNTSPKAIAKLGKRFKKDLQEFLFPENNQQFVWSKVSDKFWFKSNPHDGIANNLFPPRKWMARGYRDQGSARNLAKDASPSWPEVARQPASVTLMFTKSMEKNEKERRKRLR